MTTPKPSVLSNKFSIAFAIFLAALAVYFLTWAPLFMGYEKETALSAVAFSHGGYQIFRAGLMTVLLYQPFVAFANTFFPSHLESILTAVPMFYSAATAAIIFLVAHKITKKIGPAMAVALMVAFGSLLWPYSRVGMEYPAYFLVSLLLLTLLNWQETGGSPIFVGVVLAAAVLSKSYGVLFAVPVLIFVALHLHKQGRLRQLFVPSFFLKLFGFAILGVGAVALINLHLYGRWQGVYNLAQEFQIVSFWDGWFGTFFAFGKSLFVYSPLLLPAAFYWPAFYRRFPAIAGFTLSVLILLMLITLPFSYWSDETLSVRKLMPIVPLLHLPLLLIFEQKWGRVKTWLFGIFIVLAVYVQLINSLYPYWEQLELLKPYNLDTLATIRYNPELSNLSLNNIFFLSFIKSQLNGEHGSFYYLEKSWMREGTIPREPNAVLARVNLNLAPFDRPSIFILDSKVSKQSRQVFLLADVMVLLSAGGWLAKQALTKE